MSDQAARARSAHHQEYGSGPHALDHLMDGLRFQVSGDDNPAEEDESISSMLALIGRITETDMAADWLEAVHSRIELTRR
ncbi:hypothetical protein [Nonomuraea sp. NPDC003804]|uniref:hypothetical protein n=1 Tax=Nonomuraea sp. NPDC003804 TaxID=3154547 RepID=UPI0033AAD5B5